MALGQLQKKQQRKMQPTPTPLILVLALHTVLELALANPTAQAAISEDATTAAASNEAVFESRLHECLHRASCPACR